MIRTFLVPFMVFSWGVGAVLAASSEAADSDHSMRVIRSVSAALSELSAEEKAARVEKDGTVCQLAGLGITSFSDLSSALAENLHVDPGSIESLDISANNAVSLAPEIFTDFENLITLKITDSPTLENIDDRAFQGLIVLRSLTLDKNSNLRKVPDDMWLTLPSLLIFSCVDCALTSLPPLRAYSPLISLDCSSNRLRLFPALRGARHLVVFNGKHNRVTKLSDYMLPDPRYLSRDEAQSFFFFANDNRIEEIDDRFIERISPFGAYDIDENNLTPLMHELCDKFKEKGYEYIDGQFTRYDGRLLGRIRVGLFHKTAQTVFSLAKEAGVLRNHFLTTLIFEKYPARFISTDLSSIGIFFDRHRGKFLLAGIAIGAVTGTALALHAASVPLMLAVPVGSRSVVPVAKTVVIAKKTIILAVGSGATAGGAIGAAGGRFYEDDEYLSYRDGHVHMSDTTYKQFRSYSNMIALFSVAVQYLIGFYVLHESIHRALPEDDAPPSYFSALFNQITTHILDDEVCLGRHSFATEIDFILGLLNPTVIDELRLHVGHEFYSQSTLTELVADIARYAYPDDSVPSFRQAAGSLAFFEKATRLLYAYRIEGALHADACKKIRSFFMRPAVQEQLEGAVTLLKELSDRLADWAGEVAGRPIDLFQRCSLLSQVLLEKVRGHRS